MRKQDLERTQQAIEKADELLREYQSNLDEEAYCVAVQARGKRAQELVPADLQEANERLRGRVGRRKPSYWSPIAAAVLCVSTLLFSESIGGLLAQSEFWLNPSISIPAIVGGVATLVVGVLLQVKASNV